MMVKMLVIKKPLFPRFVTDYYELDLITLYFSILTLNSITHLFLNYSPRGFGVLGFLGARKQEFRVSGNQEARV